MSNSMPIMSSKYLQNMPMAMLNEKQAKRNHGQTLTRLAERGGICPAEAIAIMDGLGFGAVKVCPENDLLLLRRVEKFKKETKPGCHWACTGCDVCGSAGHGDSWN